MPVSLSDLREAMTIASGATPLVPKIIDRLLLEYVRKYAPIRHAIPRKTWDADVYWFNQRNQLPKAQATTEAPSTTDVASSTSNYVQKSFTVKHLQSQLDISTFAAKVALVNGNLFDLELTGAAKSMAWLEEIFHLWGSANATLNTKRPQWDGIDSQIVTANKLDGATSVVSLNNLDSMIDTVRGVAAQELGDDWFFVMSPKMQSKVNSLFLNQQRFNMPMSRIFSRDDFGVPNAAVVDNQLVDAGMEVATYRSIPIVASNFLSSLGTMGTVTASASGSGSSLSNVAYYYVVEAITKYGLTAASAEATVTPSAGQNVVLSWSTPAPTDAFGNTIDIIGYRIFRSTTSGAESLYAISSAYNTSDAAVTGFTDTGLIQDPTATNTLYAMTVASSGSNAASDGVTFPRVQTGTQLVEDIYLLPRNPEYIVCPVVNEMQTQMLAPVNARTRQFSLTEDMTLALRAGAFAAKLGRVRAA